MWLNHAWAIWRCVGRSARDYAEFTLTSFLHVMLIFSSLEKKVRCTNYLLYEYMHPACSCKCWNQGISDQCQYFVWMGLVVGKKMDHYLETKKMFWAHTFRLMRLQSRLIGIMLQPGVNFFWFRQALNLALFLIFHVGILHCVSVFPSAGQFFYRKSCRTWDLEKTLRRTHVNKIIPTFNSCKVPCKPQVLNQKHFANWLSGRFVQFFLVGFVESVSQSETKK